MFVEVPEEDSFRQTLLIWGPCAETRSPDICSLRLLTVRMTRAEGHRAKGKRLTLQQVFCKKPSFPYKFTVTLLLSSISACFHLRGQSASCLDDQTRVTAVLIPRAESLQLLQSPSKVRPQTPGRGEERG